MERRRSQKPRAHQPRPRRLGPGTTLSILPRNCAQASWGVAAALSPLPSAGPPPCVEDPFPSPGAPGAPWGRGGGGLRLLGPGGWRRSQLWGRPRRDPAPSTFWFPTQRRRRRHRTYRPERAPGAGERAGTLAGGCERASVRVSACVPVCVCASVCATGAALSSLRLRVRGRSSVGPSAQRSVPRSVRAPSPHRPIKYASAAECRAQPPDGLGTH